MNKNNFNAVTNSKRNLKLGSRKSQSKTNERGRLGDSCGRGRGADSFEVKCAHVHCPSVTAWTMLTKKYGKHLIFIRELFGRNC